MSDSVQFVCVAPKLIEGSVELDSTPNAEAVLFDNLAQWLATQEVRYPVLGVNIYYESANNRVYALVTLGSELPLMEVDDGSG